MVGVGYVIYSKSDFLCLYPTKKNKFVVLMEEIIVENAEKIALTIVDSINKMLHIFYVDSILPNAK